MTVTLTFENLAPDKGEACRADNARELPSYRRSGEVQVRFPKNDDVAALIDRMALYVSKNGYCETQHTLQHTETHCNTLQHAATRCIAMWLLLLIEWRFTPQELAQQKNATHCKTLQNTAKHCNMMQHTATRCNTLHRDVAALIDRMAL